MKKIIFISVILVVLSCKSGVDFKVLNSSNTTIDSLIISNGYDEIRFSRIYVNETKKDFMEFSSDIKNDGGYFVECYSEEFYKKENFGYYSNGIPSNTSFSIVIKKNTIKINELLKTDY